MRRCILSRILVEVGSPGVGRLLLVSKRVSDESLMVRRGVAGGWPDWWCVEQFWEARDQRATRAMHNIETSRPLVIGRRGPGLFAYTLRIACCQGGCNYLVLLHTREVVAQAGQFRYGPSGPSRLAWTMEARERCGFGQSSMRRGRATPPPRERDARSLSKALCESFDTRVRLP